MSQFIKGQDIPFTLQLIKSDNSYEDSATVTYDIYESDLITRPVSAQSASWNDDFNCYHDELDVSSLWVDQDPGNYILKWNISDTDYFASTMIEEFSISDDISTLSIPTSDEIADAVWDESTLSHTVSASFGLLVSTLRTDVKRVLGLLHENIYIDSPTYDTDNNLIGARVRIYSDSDSVGTDSDVIGTYTIVSVGDGAGKFTSWKQTGTNENDVVSVEFLPLDIDGGEF
jgi:hypothetical protein